MLSIQTGVTVQKRTIRVKIGDFCHVWPWSLTDDLENNRAPLCCYFKLCTTLRSHQWIQTWVTARTLPIWVKIDDVLSRVTLKFDRRPRKTIWHIFCAASSFAPQFVAINQFKLELPSGNAQIRKKKIVTFLLSVTLKFDGWLWKTTGHLSNATSSFVHHFIAICVLRSGNGYIGFWPL